MKKIIRFTGFFIVLSMLVFSIGTTSYATEANNSNDDSSKITQKRDDIIGYQKRIYNGKRQRRLYNFTTGTPLSDWEYY